MFLLFKKTWEFFRPHAFLTPAATRTEQFFDGRLRRLDDSCRANMFRAHFSDDFNPASPSLLHWTQHHKILSESKVGDTSLTWNWKKIMTTNTTLTTRNLSAMFWRQPRGFTFYKFNSESDENRSIFSPILKICLVGLVNQKLQDNINNITR